jgi:hypothetical protein
VATINISIPDQLKARMEASGEKTNWSEVARVAFSYRVAANELRKEPTMEKVVERLRASKAQRLEELNVEAEQAGREWASTKAEYHELEALAKVHQQIDITLDIVYATLDPEKEMSAKEFTEYLDLGNVRESELEDYIGPFVDGAVEVFHEVEDQL